MHLAVRFGQGAFVLIHGCARSLYSPLSLWIFKLSHYLKVQERFLIVTGFLYGSGSAGSAFVTTL
jgi:hypothetical protein